MAASSQSECSGVEDSENKVHFVGDWDPGS